jgi:hypothetical protein
MSTARETFRILILPNERLFILQQHRATRGSRNSHNCVGISCMSESGGPTWLCISALECISVSTRNKQQWSIRICKGARKPHSCCCPSKQVPTIRVHSTDPFPDKSKQTIHLKLYFIPLASFFPFFYFLSVPHSFWEINSCVIKYYRWAQH